MNLDGLKKKILDSKESLPVISAYWEVWGQTNLNHDDLISYPNQSYMAKSNIPFYKHISRCMNPEIIDKSMSNDL